MMHRKALALAALALPAALAAQNPAASAQPQVIVAHSATLMWKAGPPSLPPGAEITVIEGNPAESEPFTFRLRFPPNYRIPPHSHSAIEHVTVLTGTLNVGMGEQATYSGGAVLKEGSYGVIPVGMRHYAWTGADGVTIQLHSIGPWTITYVNAADDPRNKRPAGNE
ncbi:MAG TPA: cupin domain-containing protein [Gemmatimonadales bacterium]|jgi:quercetin dioxygenase-like cupin family protein|nr:cupin domain-containing protein [Gemmatimonadales bacterium]